MFKVKFRKTIWLLTSSLLLLGMVLAPVTPILATASEGANDDPVMLQFTAGGHVLGFAPDAAWLATGSHALRVGFEGANAVTPAGDGSAAASPLGEEGQKGAAPLGRVTYNNLWDGISLTYEAADGAVVKSTYHLAPGADPALIRLRYNVPVKLQVDGSLNLAFATGQMTEAAPVAWQEIRGRRAPVAVSFQVRGQTVGFSLGAYDPAYPLTIDPEYQWHTFYGGSSTDHGYAIAVDGSGNVYVAGSSQATWNGPGGESPLHAHTGSSDIVVLKLSSAGAYQWHTFYGGSGNGTSIAVDGSDVYVTGYSGAAWNGPGGESPLHAYSGGDDITVLKLGSAGAYQWHTFYGASGDDFGNAIAVDGSGGVYVAGASFATWTGDNGASPLHAYTGSIDIAVLKLSSAGAYQWHTFYGGSTTNSGRAIAVDGNDVYVTGYSDAAWNGPGGESPLHAYTGSADIVVLKLSSAGAYQWHTFYGGGGYDYGHAIAVDGSGDVYVTGISFATWTGDGGASPLHAYSLDGDIVVLKLSSAGAYQWHTFYGGNGADYGYAIAVDGSGDVYVAGHSGAAWNGPVGESPLHAYSGSSDITVLKLSSAGAYQWHTFYGGSDSDYGYAIAVDGSGDIYVAGNSYATWDGDGGASPLHAYTGGVDIAVLKLNDVAGPAQESVAVSGAGTYDFGDICGSITFTDTGSVNAFTVTLSYGYPSVNGDGLPRRYDIEADGSGFNAALMLCYEDTDLLVAGIAPSQEPALHLYRYNSGGAWEEHSEVDTINNTVTAFEIGEFGVWGFGVSGDRPTALEVNTLIARGGLWAMGLVGALGLVMICTQRKRK